MSALLLHAWCTSERSCVDLRTYCQLTSHRCLRLHHTYTTEMDSYIVYKKDWQSMQAPYAKAPLAAVLDVHRELMPHRPT